MARLAELSGQDLSGDTEVVEKLLASSKANTPFKLFGLVLKKDRNLPSLVEALSGTNHPDVREVFEEIVGGFPARRRPDGGQGPRRLRPRPRDRRRGCRRPVPSLSGRPRALRFARSSPEPGRVRNVRRRDACGARRATCSGRSCCAAESSRAVRRASSSATRPTTSFSSGRFREASSSRASRTALRTTPRPERCATSSPLTLEGMRRFDELQQATALVPDDLALKPTNVKPTPLPGEKGRDPGQRPVDPSLALGDAASVRGGDQSGLVPDPPASRPLDGDRSAGRGLTEFSVSVFSSQFSRFSLISDLI